MNKVIQGQSLPCQDKHAYVHTLFYFYFFFRGIQTHPSIYKEQLNWAAEGTWIWSPSKEHLCRLPCLAQVCLPTNCLSHNKNTAVHSSFHWTVKFTVGFNRMRRECAVQQWQSKSSLLCWGSVKERFPSQRHRAAPPHPTRDYWK